LINQYNNIDEEKVIITTYPNHFDIPDVSNEYLNKPYNTPLVIKRFLVDDADSDDNRCVAQNLPSLSDYEVKQTRWAAAGFFFVKKEWLKDVVMSDSMRFNGEEDHLTFLSFLKGWNLRVPSEATVWHNYGSVYANTDIQYREYNTFSNIKIADNARDEVNKFLFSQTYERTLNELEEYFNIKLRTPHV
jgi:hypothetical protein